jgi:hypothetical protein
MQYLRKRILHFRIPYYHAWEHGKHRLQAAGEHLITAVNRSRSRQETWAPG